MQITATEPVPLRVEAAGLGISDAEEALAAAGISFMTQFSAPADRCGWCASRTVPAAA